MSEDLHSLESTSSYVCRRFSNSLEVIRKAILKDHIANAEQILACIQNWAYTGDAIRFFVNRSLNNPLYTILVGDNSFIVHVEELFSVRLNVWHPFGSNVSAVNSNDIARFKRIDQVHNHNYDFFTVGVLGPGYCSDFKVTQNSESWEIGDTVIFDRTFSVQLSLGEALFVPKDTFFHRQHAPSSFSVSLNVIPRPVFNSCGYGLLDDTPIVNSIFAEDEPLNFAHDFVPRREQDGSLDFSTAVSGLSEVNTGLVKELYEQYEARTNLK